MPISFNFIQNNLRVPTVTAEIDNSNAVGGLGGDPQWILIGQKLYCMWFKMKLLNKPKLLLNLRKESNYFSHA